ncbi:MAG: lysylphosphatidylglycerol synthase transmembrane domain-containing protein [Anaerolineae bacterium]
MKPRHWVIFAAGLTISALSLFLVLRQKDWAEFSRLLVTARHEFILLRIGILLAALAAQGLRWSILAERRLSTPDGFWLFGIGMLFNNILPARLGEGVRLALASRREQMDAFSAGTSIVAERLTDVLALAALSLVFFTHPAVPQQFTTAGILTGAVGLAGVTFVLVFGSISPQKLLAVTGRLCEALRLKDGLRHRILEAVERVVLSIPSAGRFLLALAWALVIWALGAGAAWVLMLAFWPAAPPWIMGVVTVVAAGLGIAVPSGPAGVGTFEAAVAGSLIFFGYEPDISITFALIMHLTVIATTSSVGVVGLLREGVRLNALLAESSTVQHAQQAKD